MVQIFLFVCFLVHRKICNMGKVKIEQMNQLIDKTGFIWGIIITN